MCLEKSLFSLQLISVILLLRSVCFKSFRPLQLQLWSFDLFVSIFAFKCTFLLQFAKEKRKKISLKFAFHAINLFLFLFVYFSKRMTSAHRYFGSNFCCNLFDYHSFFHSFYRFFNFETLSLTFCFSGRHDKFLNV